MGKKRKSKKNQAGPPHDGSHRMGKARKRNRWLIYAIVGIVVLGWLAVIIGFLFGGSTPPPAG
jgi:hypothetical protein